MSGSPSAGIGLQPGPTGASRVRVNDEIEILTLVAGRLDAAGIDYMITGSMALSRYAEPRMTRDIDLVVPLEPEQAGAIAELFRDEFDCDADSIRSAIARRGMFNLIHTTRIVKVDVIVRRQAPFRIEEFSRRRPIELGGQQVWVATPEDVLLSKLVWARDSRPPVQLADAANLIRSTPIDWSYTERWAVDLGVADLLNEVRQ